MDAPLLDQEFFTLLDKCRHLRGITPLFLLLNQITIHFASNNNEFIKWKMNMMVVSNLLAIKKEAEY